MANPSAGENEYKPISKDIKRGESMRFATCCLNRRRRKWILALFGGAILLLAGVASAQDRSQSAVPMAFEPNEGQADAEVKFMARGRGYSLFLTATESVLSL